MKLNVIDCSEEEDLFSSLKNGDENAFGEIYDRYSGRLYTYLFRLSQDRVVTCDLLQNVFLALWDNHRKISIKLSLETYLYSVCKKQFLNYVREDIPRKKYTEYITQYAADIEDNSTEELMDLKDLEDTIDNSVSQLPKKCQKVFRLSRMEHLPIAYIAMQMNLSPRTVENHLSRALKHIRSSLGAVMALLVLMVCL